MNENIAKDVAQALKIFGNIFFEDLEIDMDIIISYIAKKSNVSFNINNYFIYLDFMNKSKMNINISNKEKTLLGSMELNDIQRTGFGINAFLPTLDFTLIRGSNKLSGSIKLDMVTDLKTINSTYIGHAELNFNEQELSFNNNDHIFVYLNKNTKTIICTPKPINSNNDNFKLYCTSVDESSKLLNLLAINKKEKEIYHTIYNRNILKNNSFKICDETDEFALKQIADIISVNYPKYYEIIEQIRKEISPEIFDKLSTICLNNYSNEEYKAIFGKDKHKIQKTFNQIEKKRTKKLLNN